MPRPRPGDNPFDRHQSADAALRTVVSGLRDAPQRTWSIIITVYGDAIVPRGGSVWLGTLLTLFQALDIADGVVRTAMSRLASDGWLERRKVGRNSFYRLADKGRETFAEATRHIYAPRAPDYPGHLGIVLADPGLDRVQRSAMVAHGFGSPSPGVWLSSQEQIVPDGLAGALAFRAEGDLVTMRALVARSWPLDAMAAAYRDFIARFTPLRSALARDCLADVDALVARTLVIHQYRRVVLRDPQLPLVLLPEDWPGDAARALCASLYRHLLEPSERWLDRYAVDETGTSLARSAAVSERFGDASSD